MAATPALTPRDPHPHLRVRHLLAAHDLHEDKL
jgi:hypothetical protein